VATNTLSLGLTASVAIVRTTLRGVQHTKPVKLDIADLPDDDVGDRAWPARPVERGEQDRVGRIGARFELQPAARVPAL
jgi:hypothetical protein